MRCHGAKIDCIANVRVPHTELHMAAGEFEADAHLALPVGGPVGKHMHLVENVTAKTPPFAMT